MKKRPIIQLAPTIRQHIVDGFYDLEDFKNFLMQAIKREERILSEQVGSTSKSMAEEEMDQIGDMFAEDFYRIEDVFNRLSLNAFVVIICSYIEDGLTTQSTK